MGVEGSHEGRKMMSRGIRMIVMLVFLGSIFLWIMMPTSTYKLKWNPTIQAHTNSSTFFGSMGARLLLYMFPTLLIAALGCGYLHLSNKSEESESNRVSIWKRPVLVKGPLGIVSGTELAFVTMFIALLIWSIATYIRTNFATINKQSAAKYGENLWQAKLADVALRLGLVGNLCLAFLFFPVTRGSSLLTLLGLTSEGSIKYHIWLGHIAMVLFTAHGLFYITVWIPSHRLVELLKWEKIGVAVLPGVFALLCGIAMWITAISRIRRKNFELFFYTHYLYSLFFLFFVFHVGFSYSIIMLPGFYLFMIDRYLRFSQSQTHVRLLSSRVLACEVVELNFAKTPGLRYSPTSTVFVNVPSISKLQWHPFTVTSNSTLEPERLSVLIKSTGSWSKKLYQILSSPTSIDRLEVSIEGPYGPVSTPYLSYDTLVMISGGSGITPFISIIREIIYKSTTQNCKNLPKILLISSFRHSSDLNMLDLILPISGIPSDISTQLQIQIEAYITRDKEPTIDNKNSQRTIWFKPNPIDIPISAPLGPNSWLWLGAIITSSFIIFLILLGILTRYYIYPIDHNTNKIFSCTLKSFLYLLLLCISIAMTSSVVLLWNKNKNSNGVNQVQGLDGPTPTTSPRFWFYKADGELESLPNESLIQSTELHFGTRPNLKKILFECEGSKTGILTSGPKELRHEVANICASGLANNLNFESISFSW